MRSSRIVLLTIVATAWGAAPNARFIEVSLKPLPHRELRIGFSATGADAAAEFALVLRNSLGCEWRAEEPPHEGDRYSQGSCEALLRADTANGVAHLALAPLVEGLRQAGYTTILLNIGFAARADSAPPNIHGWTAVRSGSQNIYYFSSITGEVPEPFPILLRDDPDPPPTAPPLPPADPRRFLISLAILAVVPAAATVLAGKLANQGSRGAALGYARWVITSLWVYWIWAVPLDSVAALVIGPEATYPLLRLAAGCALYALPPTGITALITAMLRGRLATADRSLRAIAGPMAQGPWMATVFAVLIVGYRIAASSMWVWMAGIGIAVALTMR